MKLGCALCSFLFALPCWACEEDPVQSVKKGQPADVIAFLDRVLGCARAPSRKATEALKCDDRTKDELEFQKRFSDNAKALNALNVVKSTVK